MGLNLCLQHFEVGLFLKQFHLLDVIDEFINPGDHRIVACNQKSDFIRAGMAFKMLAERVRLHFPHMTG